MKISLVCVILSALSAFASCSSNCEENSEELDTFELSAISHQEKLKFAYETLGLPDRTNLKDVIVQYRTLRAKCLKNQTLSRKVELAYQFLSEALLIPSSDSEKHRKHTNKKRNYTKKQIEISDYLPGFLEWENEGKSEATTTTTTATTTTTSQSTSIDTDRQFPSTYLDYPTSDSLSATFLESPTSTSLRKRANPYVDSESNSDFPIPSEIIYVGLNIYLTKEESGLYEISKQFTYNLECVGFRNMTLNLKLRKPLITMTEPSRRMLVRNYFQKVLPQLKHARMLINFYFEKYDEYISKQHFYSRLQSFSSFEAIPNDLLQASKKCSDVFIIKISNEESKEGFVRSYSLNKYGIFTISHGPVADYTFFQNDKLDFCALVTLKTGSLFDLKSLSNQAPRISSESRLINSLLHPPLQFYGNIETFTNVQNTNEGVPILITYDQAVEGLTITKPGAQIVFEPGFALKQSEKILAFQINSMGIKTDYTVFVNKSQELLHASFYDPLKNYAWQNRKEIGNDDLVYVFKRQEGGSGNSVSFITAHDGMQKLAISIPMSLFPGFYFIKGLGKTDLGYLIIHIQ